LVSTSAGGVFTATGGTVAVTGAGMGGREFVLFCAVALVATNTPNINQ
jgi:hypothetical protein